MNGLTPDILHQVWRTDFVAFLQKAFETIHPGAEFLANWHHEAIAHALEQCKLGIGHNQLVVNLPPRHLKSEIISVIYAAFLLGHEPDASVITISYGADLVKRLSRQRRQIMEADWYKKTFPKTRISPTKNTETEFETTMGGRCYATTVHGELTGHGAKYIFIDDPHNVSQQPSAEALKSTWEWCKGGVFTRFEKPETGAFIVVMQRYHPNDLAGYLLSDARFRQLKIPAIATADEDIPLIGGGIHARKKGDVLHKEWISHATLDDRKKIMGAGAFEAQYQQDPKLGGLSLFKPEYFPRFDDVYPREGYEYVLQTWDCGSSLSEDNSYSVCMTFGVRNNNLHLLHVFRDRREFPDLLKAANNLVDYFGPTHVCIEAAALGVPLIHEMRAQYGGAVTSDKPATDKVSRAESVMHIVNEGRVLLPSAKCPVPHFMPVLEQELFAFPGAPHDDQVDALVVALRFVGFNGFAAHAPLNYGNKKPSLNAFKSQKQ
jgi:predicted phage terminase large subunit-like protein